MQPELRRKWDISLFGIKEHSRIFCHPSEPLTITTEPYPVDKVQHQTYESYIVSVLRLALYSSSQVIVTILWKFLIRWVSVNF